MASQVPSSAGNSSKTNRAIDDVGSGNDPKRAKSAIAATHQPAPFYVYVIGGNGVGKSSTVNSLVGGAVAHATDSGVGTQFIHEYHQAPLRQIHKYAARIIILSEGEVNQKASLACDLLTRLYAEDPDNDVPLSHRSSLELPLSNEASSGIAAETLLASIMSGPGALATMTVDGVHTWFKDRRQLSALQLTNQVIQLVAVHLQRPSGSLCGVARSELYFETDDVKGLAKGINSKISEAGASSVVDKVVISCKDYFSADTVLVDTPFTEPLTGLDLRRADSILLVCTKVANHTSPLIASLHSIGVVDKVIVVRTHIDTLTMTYPLPDSPHSSLKGDNQKTIHTARSTALTPIERVRAIKLRDVLRPCVDRVNHLINMDVIEQCCQTEVATSVQEIEITETTRVANPSGTTSTRHTVIKPNLPSFCISNWDFQQSTSMSSIETASMSSIETGVPALSVYLKRLEHVHMAAGNSN